MPSDIANQIVKQVFGDDKASAIDSINDALGSATYDAIQARKIEFAKSVGFDLGDTGQDDADEISAELPDNSESPNVEDDQSEPPVAELEQPPEEENETDS